jgi:tRNA U38,U39,U40 pseudouridine synthase TruA
MNISQLRYIKVCRLRDSTGVMNSLLQYFHGVNHFANFDRKDEQRVLIVYLLFEVR